MTGVEFGGMGWIAILVFWVAIVALAVWVLGKLFPQIPDASSSQPRARRADPPESSREVREQRYARGEIVRSEYEARRRGRHM